MSHGFSNRGIVIALIACVLAACGGGGGGGGSPPPPPPPPPPTFTVGGSISGLKDGATLQISGSAQLSVSANGPFTFAGTVAAGSAYAVTVAEQPELQACTVANGSGTANANVTNITISCADLTRPTLTLSLQAIKTFRFAWTSVPGITRYKLFEDPTGNAGFTQVGADIDPSATSLDQFVPLHRRVNASYKVQACAATRCIDSNIVSATRTLAEAVGYFKAESIAAFDQFGTSIALSAEGTTLAVGVPFEDSDGTGVEGDRGNNGNPDSGAVYVFVREGAAPGWVQQAYIKASNTADGDRFGHAVALDSAGSTLAVSAVSENSVASDSGAVYVLERSNGRWAHRAILKASDVGQGESAGQGDLFGSSLALSDQGQLAVGAPREDGAGNLVQDSGAVYVFVKEAAAQGFAWRQDAYLKASNSGRDDRFGESVALSRDGATLAVGAHFEDSDTRGVNPLSTPNELAAESGAVYVFTHAAQWAQQAYIKASNAGEGDNFGVSVALSADGSTLAVGADFENGAATGVGGNEDDNAAPGAGAAYVFVRTGTEWEQQSYIKASNTERQDGFGVSLALSTDGSILAVGADAEASNAIGIDGDESDNSAVAAGAAYVFERVNEVWAQRAYVKPSNTASAQRFGEAVALSGDGETLAAGALGESGSASGIDGDQSSPPAVAAGAVYLY